MAYVAVDPRFAVLRSSQRFERLLLTLHLQGDS
jgi:hypothetical protein